MNYEESESKLHQLEEENSHLKEVVRNRNVIIQQYQKVQEQPKESTSTQHLSINSSTSQEDSILNRTIDKLINESKSLLPAESSLLKDQIHSLQFANQLLLQKIHEQNEAYKQKISYFEDTIRKLKEQLHNNQVPISKSNSTESSGPSSPMPVKSIQALFENSTSSPKQQDDPNSVDHSFSLPKQ